MEGRRPCPYCAEPILAEARKCPFCREALPGAAPFPAAPPPVLVSRDDEHLKLLSVFHYVLAGITALFGTFPLIHVAMGIAVVSGGFSKDSSGGGPPPEFGWFFIVIGGAFFLGGWTLAVLLFVAARSMARRRRHFFCLLVAGASCFMMPLGTVLGVFTFVVLLRPNVKLLFEGATPDEPPR